MSNTPRKKLLNKDVKMNLLFKVNTKLILILLISFASILVAGDLISNQSKITGFIVEPQLSPLQNFISIERGTKKNRTIVFTDRQLTFVDEIVLQKKKEDQEPESWDWDISIFENKSTKNIEPGSSFQLDWRPILDANGQQWFVFVSSGEKNQYDIYLSYLDKTGMVGEVNQITNDGYVDMYPKWSPDGQKIIFVSNKSGKGDLYLIDNINLYSDSTKIANPQRITNNIYEDNHPVWSPDGKYIAYSAIMSEKNRNNYGINLVKVSEFGSKIPKPIRLTNNSNEEETKPSWSPLDNDLIAFYTSRAGNKGNKINIGILRLYKNTSNGTIQGAAKPKGTPSPNLVYNVVPNENSGPSWLPISKSNSIVYIKRDESRFNPVHQASVNRWYNSQIPFEQPLSLIKTQMNSEITAFATSFGYLMLYSRQLAEKGFVLSKIEKGIDWNIPKVQKDISKESILIRTAVPGLAQYYKGEKKKGIIIAGAEALLITGYIYFANKNKNLASEVKTLQSKYSSAEQNDTKRLWGKLNNKYDESISARNVALVFGSVFLVGMAYSIYDALQGAPGTIQVPVQGSGEKTALKLGVSYNSSHSIPVFTSTFSF